MYVDQGVSGLGAAGHHPLSQLPRQFPWISPGELLDDGAVSYSVAKQWDGGVRLYLYDRGGIMVDSQDFFHTPTPVGGMGDDGRGPVAHGLEYGGIFGAPEGIFIAMGARPRSKAVIKPHVAVGLAGRGIFGQNTFHAMDGLGDDNTPTSLSVTVIQRGLHAAGTSPSPGTVDGDWGPATLASLRAYVVRNHPLMAISQTWRDSLAQLTATAPRTRAVVLPNLIASRLERHSGSYRAPTTTTRTRTTTTTGPAPVPGGNGAPAPGGKPGAAQPGAGNGKSGGALPGGELLPDGLPGQSFLTRPMLGAPTWVWLVAGGLLAASGGLVLFTGRKRRPRRRPAAVAANRHRRRRRRRR
ncbi:MAG TPA: hypothetical protein VIY27_02585, partial [Myxococcota bacterium]